MIFLVDDEKSALDPETLSRFRCKTTGPTWPAAKLAGPRRS